MNKTESNVFVITGSAQGIGKELATQILKLGGKVVFNSRKKEKISLVKNLLNQYKDHCFFVAADVTVPGEAELLISETIKHFGRIDVLINNAGVSGYGALSESSPIVIEEIMKSNILGSIFPTRFALPHLINSKGKVLFISSLAAFHGLPEYSLYSSSKMALTALYQSLKKELHPKGVFVGIAYVGFTKNDIGKRTFAPDGTLEKVPERNKFKVVSQEKTARLLLKQLSNEEALNVHSVMGKFAFLLSRIFPSLLDHLFLHNYLKSQKKDRIS
jgi:dehydrogenase/reductase SDR family member 7B